MKTFPLQLFRLRPLHASEMLLQHLRAHQSIACGLLDDCLHPGRHAYQHNQRAKMYTLKQDSCSLKLPMER